MPIEVTHWAFSAYQAFNRSMGFMPWNLFLAFIPWVLSLWLFKGADSDAKTSQGKIGGIVWWVCLAAFVAFLPNAPYILTDVIHLVEFIRQGAAMWTIVFIWMPQYFLFMLLGAEAYVLSLINLGRYLKAQGKQRWVTPAELTLHALCALGIYLGRVPRFNSWDLLTHPGKIVSFMAHDIVQPQPLAVMLVMFLTLLAVYWPLKHLSLATMLYVRTLNKREESDAVAFKS